MLEWRMRRTHSDGLLIWQRILLVVVLPPVTAGDHLEAQCHRDVLLLLVLFSVSGKGLCGVCACVCWEGTRKVETRLESRGCL